ncbi:lysozyme [Streptomyces fuscigenes]|uniref:lysozyme n=1 Tax=Streptomyces fuscigenes TaxID=1528880 RepID=UPI001F2370E5|nr:lysozyme [Streptomyces fuscigenes]MCF3963187.1 lysozyme [Streptomyces fuscigenes]
MPVQRHGKSSSRRTLYAAGAALLATFALPLTLPGVASADVSPVPIRPAAVPPADAMPARGSAYMGMGVLAHDGQGPRPLARRSAAVTQTEGVDVSSHQGSVDWGSLAKTGVKWAYVKATEGNYYKSTSFNQQYTGSYNAGLIRGSYHFAAPDVSSGANQAGYFADHGGAWSKDGKTLPGVLDIEWNPYGASCYGLSKSAMVSWIKDFTKTYKARTGRDAVIYTATTWWKDCTGDYAGFATTNPLWVARYDTSPGTLPKGWGFHTIWQYTSTGPAVGDHDKFNGAMDRLKALANG